MAGSSCRADWVELIFDNYKSRHCGQTTKPWSIITNTNFVTVRFSSNYRNPYTGFLAIWSATTAPPTYPPSTGCDSCTFPFVLYDRIKLELAKYYKDSKMTAFISERSRNSK